MAAGEKLVVLREVKGGAVYTNGMFRIDGGIASYPHLDEPYAGEDGGVAKYSITHLLDKVDHAGIIEEMIAAVRKMMADKKVKVGADKLFIKDGDKYFEDKEECKGKYVITAREETRPTLRNEKKRKLDPKTEMETIKELFYGGAVVSTLINPWYQDNKFGKRINANLKAVKFDEHGTPFGEGRISDDGAWGDEDGDEDGDGWDSNTDGDDDGI